MMQRLIEIVGPVLVYQVENFGLSEDHGAATIFDCTCRDCDEIYLTHVEHSAKTWANAHWSHMHPEIRPA